MATRNVRKRHKKTLKTVNFTDFSLDPKKRKDLESLYDDQPGDEEEEINVKSSLPLQCQKLPWETREEYERFLAFMYCPKPRSVRKAYRAYCKANGVAPKKDPPSNWYQLAKGQNLAVRKTDRLYEAILKAEEKHNRPVNWEGMEAVLDMTLEAGELDQDLYKGPFGEMMAIMKMIELGFESIAIDLNGDPLPGKLTWEELFAIKHPQV